MKLSEPPRHPEQSRGTARLTAGLKHEVARLRFASLGMTVLGIATLLCSCAAPRPIEPDAPPPQAMELQAPQKIATMHFRPGVYFLDSSDGSGYYYRAPEGVIEHSFGGSIRREGGIFLARYTRKMRGYVSWAGERRKIGSISDVEFLR